jgi:hypothetical protein
VVGGRGDASAAAGVGDEPAAGTLGGAAEPQPTARSAMTVIKARGRMLRMVEAGDGTHHRPFVTSGA